MALFFQKLVYFLLLWLALPLIPLRLFLRGLKERGYWRNLSERFGSGGTLTRHPLWIHAVSVGETRAAAPLVEGFLAQGKSVLVTCMTPAGRATGEQLFGGRAEVRYLPYDYAWAVRRFLRRVRPAMGVIMETELWPNLVREAGRAQIPLFLANARLSQKSADGYRRFAALTREVLRGFKAVAAQTEDDAARLRDLGAREVCVTGNLKFDIAPPPAQLALAGRFREMAGNRPVWLAASTRDGEEALILHAFREAAPQHVLLLLVPRHPQRFDAVATLVRNSGLKLQRRSENAQVSLLAYGGQNLIEACAVGCPVLVGPHTENFKQVAEEAVARGAALRVRDAADWAARAAELMGNETARQRMGEAGRCFSVAHKGAAEKVLRLVNA